MSTVIALTLRVYREDTSRLYAADPVDTVKLIYEPLLDLVVDRWLRPYRSCVNDITFYHHWDDGCLYPLAETKHLWRAGTLVVSEGQTWKTFSSQCVYRNGQWCMEWYCQRVNIAEPKQ